MSKNLASEAVVSNLLGTATFIALGLVIQSVYLVVDLHFVATLGDQAVAGVTIVSLASLVTNAGYQAICIGAIALVGQALGRGQLDLANRVIAAALLISLFCGVAIIGVGYSLGGQWAFLMSASAGTAAAARAYLFAALPSYACMFPVAVISSILRAAGAVRGATIVFVSSTLAKAALTPLLLRGIWGLPTAGVVGAGLASSVAISASLVAMLILLRTHHQLRLSWRSLCHFRDDFRAILRIGLPASGEMGMVFLTTITIQWALRGNGAAAQAGFGAAMRMSQIMLIPAMAIALAVVPQVAQCVGAGRSDRKQRSLRWAVVLTTATTCVVALAGLLFPARLLSAVVAADPITLARASEYLPVLAMAFVPTGIAYVASAYGQGIAHTLPALMAAALRVPTCIAPVLAITLLGRGNPAVLLGISVTSVWIQALASWMILSRWPSGNRVLMAAGT